MAGVLVIGWGNPLRQDDGAGYRAAAVLGGIAVQQLGPELSLDVAAADRVVFIDSDSRLDPGDWRVDPLLSESAPTGATHSCAPFDIVRLAGMLYDAAPQCLLIRIGGRQYGHGEDLTPAVAQAIDAVVAYVAAYVAAYVVEYKTGSA